MACVTPTSTQASVALPVPRAVSGTSSSRGHESVDVLLADLQRAAQPLRISIPPSDEEKSIWANQAKLAAYVAAKERRDEKLVFNNPLTSLQEIEWELTRLCGEADRFKNNIRRGIDVEWMMSCLRVVTPIIIQLQEQLEQMRMRELKTQVLDLGTHLKTSWFTWLAARA